METGTAAAETVQTAMARRQVLPVLFGAARRLDRIAAEHPLLTEALEALDRAVIEAGEAEDKISRAVEVLAHDPAALDRIETRLFDLRALIPIQLFDGCDQTFNRRGATMP